MKEIPDLLNRFKRILYSHNESQKILSDSVYECLNIRIINRDIEIKSDTVYINCSSVVKNEILINNRKIIDTFHKKGGNLDISEIK